MQRASKSDGINNYRIIGIDPGTARVGWGIIDIESGQEISVDYGCIETPKHKEAADRLLQIRHELLAILNEFKPDFAVVERLYFSRNQKTAIAVAEARGVITMTLAEKTIGYQQLAPNEIKLSVTGNGKADKKEIQHMVQQILNLHELPRPDDAADGLALALCYRHITELEKDNAKRH